MSVVAHQGLGERAYSLDRTIEVFSVKLRTGSRGRRESPEVPDARRFDLIKPNVPHNRAVRLVIGVVGELLSEQAADRLQLTERRLHGLELAEESGALRLDECVLACELAFNASQFIGERVVC